MVKFPARLLQNIAFASGCSGTFRELFVRVLVDFHRQTPTSRSGDIHLSCRMIGISQYLFPSFFLDSRTLKICLTSSNFQVITQKLDVRIITRKFVLFILICLFLAWCFDSHSWADFKLNMWDHYSQGVLRLHTRGFSRPKRFC